MKSKAPESNASVRAQIHNRKKPVATRERGVLERVRDDVDGERMAIPANTSILVSLGLPVVIEALEIFL